MIFAELISGCKQNDRRAQKLLVERYASFLFAISLRYMRDEAEAKDNVQDTFVSVFKYLDQFKEGEDSFKAWVRKICVNNALQKFRKKSYNNEAYPDQLPDEHAEMPSVYSKMGADELMTVIESLPELYRQVFCLYVVEEYSHREIGEMLNMKESSSRSALTRAKRMIKDKLWQLQKVVA